MLIVGAPLGKNFLGSSKCVQLFWTINFSKIPPSNASNHSRKSKAVEIAALLAFCVCMHACMRVLVCVHGRFAVCYLKFIFVFSISQCCVCMIIYSFALIRWCSFTPALVAFHFDSH